MSKRFALLVGMSISALILSGCGRQQVTQESQNAPSSGAATTESRASHASRQSESSHTTPPQSQQSSESQSATGTHQSYRDQIQAAYDRQLKYRDSLKEADRQTVQTPYAAAVAQAEMLKMQHPSDTEAIKQALTDFMRTLGIGQDSSQSYRDQIQAAYDRQLKYRDSLKEAERQAVQTPLAAAVAQAEMLKMQHPSDADTIQQALKTFLTAIHGESSDQSSSVSDNQLEQINLAMTQYGQAQGQTYLQATPATERSYYDWMVPDQVLAQAHVDGQAAHFQFYGMSLGPGEVSYRVMALYVNQEGTHLVVFALKDEMPVILEATARPDAQGIVNLATTQAADLLKALQ